jgi:alginate O-acetyltransferase complex protein AlgI
MLFNSLDFFIFFPVVTLFYFLIPHKLRILFLLLASCFFYMYFIPSYILILAATITVDFAAGILIERTAEKNKKIFLIISIVVTCLILFFFKYFNFFNNNLVHLARLINWNYSSHMLSLALPIGLSFHTFQSLSYVIEVYKGKQRAEKNFLTYSLYVMFYPQLVAGPIERPQNLLHQFYEKHTFDYQRVVDGLKLMAWGLFKKVVIADRLAFLVNEVYNHPTDYYGLPLIIATVFFAVQIYCDFSGYSDIAIGAAQVMGFKLMQNFNRPYLAKSVFEFWQRWHISLSTWFRDYVYIPLGGNRMGKWRWQFNLFITFLISGLWHGANWTYIIWGSLNGFYLIFSIWTKDYREKLADYLSLTKYPQLHNFLKTIVIFILISFSWIFFRANSVSEAIYIVQHLFVNLGKSFNDIYNIGLNNTEFFIAVSGIIFLLAIELIQEKYGRIIEMLSKRPLWFRYASYASLLSLILLFGIYSSNSTFIYFQF